MGMNLTIYATLLPTDDADKSLAFHREFSVSRCMTTWATETARSRR